MSNDKMDTQNCTYFSAENHINYLKIKDLVEAAGVGWQRRIEYRQLIDFHGR